MVSPAEVLFVLAASERLVVIDMVVVFLIVRPFADATAILVVGPVVSGRRLAVVEPDAMNAKHIGQAMP